ncbi:MAG: hypothetical protein IPK16_04895 [Anaerolineales bacterium]|nr:hypothetical protein [Anaerolineales bacterium]
MTTAPSLPAPQHGTHRGWRRALHWAPRVLSILFIAFISLFALDVFGAGYSPWETLVALTMHLIPTFLLIVVVVAAWRWPWVGALAFCGFGAWYIVTSWGMFDWTAPALIGGVPIGVGLLFLGDWMVRRRHGMIPL